MKKIIEVLKSWWFISALNVVCSVVLLLLKEYLFAGFFLGFVTRQLLLCFQQEFKGCYNCSSCHKELCSCKMLKS